MNPPRRHAGRTHSPLLPRSVATPSTSMRIINILATPAVNKPLAGMGPNIGAKIAVCQRQGDGFVVVRGQTRFALGAGMAHRIMVCTIDAESS